MGYGQNNNFVLVYGVHNPVWESSEQLAADLITNKTTRLGMSLDFLQDFFYFVEKCVTEPRGSFFIMMGSFA